jgi:predicted transglutaminase-like cysteine proteinase
LAPVDVVLDQSALATLTRIDLWVNHNIRPETDMDHYGMIQWWRYPDDGAGACHSYALLKRRMLMQAGWPRQALLITIVHESDNEGHAVLTVATDHGDYILDNAPDKILLWSQTPYLYYMRQSQGDPNAWDWIKTITPTFRHPPFARPSGPVCGRRRLKQTQYQRKYDRAAACESCCLQLSTTDHKIR